jgi:hypothetical protein
MDDRTLCWAAVMPAEAAETIITAATASAIPMMTMALCRLRRVMPRRMYSSIAFLTVVIRQCRGYGVDLCATSTRPIAQL